MVIFGMYRKRHPIGLGKLYCQRCNDITTWVRVLQKRAFTLIFIPLIPISQSRKIICGGCGQLYKDLPFEEDLLAAMLQEAGTSMDGEAMTGMVAAMAQAQTAPDSNAMEVWPSKAVPVRVPPEGAQTVWPQPAAGPVPPVPAASTDYPPPSGAAAPPARAAPAAPAAAAAPAPAPTSPTEKLINCQGCKTQLQLPAGLTSYTCYSCSGSYSV